tara:strand:+ start:84 stop:371 length:288 start_codon:yes stop_codon:yes gene_type:complete
MAKGFKTGGRQKGTPNKVTSELKELLKEFILDEFKELKPRIEELDTNQRLQILTKLMPYALPKESEQMNHDQKNAPIEPVEFRVINVKPIETNRI